MNEINAFVVRVGADANNSIDIIKDIALPIVLSLISSGFALLIAFKSFHYQERIANEKRKVDEVNKWYFMAEEAWQNLIAIKSNYFGKINSDPLTRLTAIPPMLSLDFKSIELGDRYKLAFLVPNKEDYIEGVGNKWSNVNMISNIFSNYNVVIGLWRFRNEIYIPCREKVLSGIDKSYTYKDLEELRRIIGDQLLTQLIDLTEKSLIYTDDLIVIFYRFFKEFPAYAKSRINIKIIKEYHRVMSMTLEQNEYISKIIIKSPDADYSSVVDLFGMNLEEIKKQYERLYEQLD